MKDLHCELHLICRYLLFFEFRQPVTAIPVFPQPSIKHCFLYATIVTECFPVAALGHCVVILFINKRPPRKPTPPPFLHDNQPLIPNLAFSYLCCLCRETFYLSQCRSAGSLNRNIFNCFVKANPT